MDMDKLGKEMRNQIDQSSSLFNKEEAWSEFSSTLASRKRIAEMSMQIADTTLKISRRLMGVSAIRNNNYHTLVPTYLEVLRDPEQPLNFKVKLAEALGWFTLSYRKDEIVAACRQLAATPGVDLKLKNELVKTVNRLEVYMR
jgi:hypothetical protein